MSSLFYKIFQFNARNKGIFFGALFLLIILFFFQIFKLQFQENISDIFPKDEQLSQVEVFFNSSGIHNNLIIHIYNSDSSKELADSIIAMSDSIDSTLKSSYPDLIKSTMLYYPDTLVTRLYDYFLQYLPLYLQEEDYQAIDKKISEEGIKSALQSNFKALMSPVGIFGSRMVQKDPFGLVQLPLQNFQKAQFDDNFNLYKNHLLSKDRRHLLYFVELNNQANETSENGKLIGSLEALANSLSNASIKIEYFGAPAVAVANANRIKKDVYTSVSLAVVMILVLIILYFRSVREFFLVLVPGFLGMLSALALLSVLRDQISLISLGVGSIMVGITVDYALHLFTHYKDEPTFEKVFKSISQPILMSSFTTACAFFALVFINSKALIDLGLFVGISVLMASFAALLILPHLLSGKQSRKEGRQSFFEKFLKRFASLKIYSNRMAQIFFVGTTVVSVFYWHEIAFDSDLYSLNYMPDELKQSEENLEKVSSLSGKKLYLLVTGNDLWDALEHGRPLSEKLEELKANHEISEFNSLNNIIPDLLTQRKKLEYWDSYWNAHNTQDLQQLISQEASSIGFNNEVYKGLNTYLDNEYQKIDDKDLDEILRVIGDKYILNYQEKTSLITVVSLDPENKDKIIQQLSNLPGVQILDRGPIAEKLVAILSHDFNKLITVSLLVIFGILLVIYGRIEMALITIAPIAIGWLWTLGLMTLFGLTFNIVNIIICSLIFGLGVDYSIFNMSGLSLKYAKGQDNRVSFRVSILLSGITTLIGIGVLIFAQHPAIKSVALIAIIGITSVIFLTLFVQDALYAFFIQNRKNKGVIPYTLLSFLLSVIAFSLFLVGCIILMIVRIIFYIPIWPSKQKQFYHFLIMLYCRLNLYIMANLRIKIKDRDNINFRKPSIIIANHQSFLDILIMLMFHPRVVMVTNDWVYNSPFFGMVVRYADFLLATKGIENQLEKAEQLIKDGYSIMVFPEGTRSEDGEIRRFHKGAFYLAEKLQVDIQPVVIHGTHFAMPKKDGFCMRSQTLTIKFLNKIAISDSQFGSSYKERTKKISVHFKNEYANIKGLQENHLFYTETIRKNYLFKGPVIEWYYRIKIKLENHYSIFHQILPTEGTIVDIGCGYGFLCYSLALNQKSRKITGIDYDRNKIEIASNCPVIPDNLNFVYSDALSYPYTNAEAYILSDILHYLKDYEQQELLEKLIAGLNPGGLILVRDGDRDMKSRHIGTKITEFFSTNIGFNQTRNNLNYISEKWLNEVAVEHELEYKRIVNTRFTSNTFSILKKPDHGKI